MPDRACTGGAAVIGIDLVPERLERARGTGVEVLDLRELRRRHRRAPSARLTGGRGPDAVIDAVGMEAHGSPARKFAQQMTGLLPDAVAAKLMETRRRRPAGAPCTSAIDMVRRGGTISLSGVYGGDDRPDADDDPVRQADPAAHGPGERQRWIDDILPLLTDDDPLGVEDFATHRLPLDEAPEAYETFQKKRDGAIKVLLKP